MISPEKVIAFAIRDRTVLDQLGPALRSDLVVANPLHRLIITFADDFFSEKRKLPLPGDWELWLAGLPAGQKDGVKEALGQLFVIDTSGHDASYFAQQVISDLRSTAARNAVARLNAQPSEISAEALQLLNAQVEAIESGGITGLANLRDVDTWTKSLALEDPLLPTGWPSLDKLIGGWGEELWVIFADSGVGKSMFLQNAGKSGMQRGKLTIHISLELGIRPQIRRYYREIAQATQGEFVSDLEGSKKKVRHWLRFAKGELLLLEYPAYSLDTDQLKRVIDRIGRTYDDVGLIIIDYADLLILPKRMQSRSRYEDLGRISHLVRALSSEFAAPVLSASQAVRKPGNAMRLTLKDMGDSYDKVRAADGILSLVQTEEEEKNHQGRIGVLKVRDSGGRGNEIPVYMNRELALIADLDHPNTLHLMKRLGHLPIPKTADPSPPGSTIIRS